MENKTRIRLYEHNETSRLKVDDFDSLEDVIKYFKTLDINIECLCELKNYGYSFKKLL